MGNKSTGRDYSYDTNYESSPLQKRRRAARNAARLDAIKDGKVSKGDKQHDLDHIRRNISGGLSNAPGNLRVVTVKSNRSRHSPGKKG